MHCAICLHPLAVPGRATATVHADCVGPCPHPLADQRILGSIVGPVFRRPGQTETTAVTFRCARCGEHTTVSTPRKGKSGTDATTPASEASHAE